MKKRTPKVVLTKEDMWSLRNNQIDGGIDGYVLPKEIYDHKQIKWMKDRADILKNPKAYRKAPKLDDDGNPIPPPKRPNFLDDTMKWAKSFYDKERAEKTLEECEQKGHPLLAPLKPKEYRKLEYPKREFFTDLLIKEEKKKYIQREDREDMIQELIEKIKEDESKKVDPMKKLKEDYGTKDEEGRLVKATFGKSTRVTVVSEAEHVGEKYPFYNTYVNPDGEDENPKKKKLFFPSVSYLINLIIYYKENCCFKKSSNLEFQEAY